MISWHSSQIDIFRGGFSGLLTSGLLPFLFLGTLLNSQPAVSETSALCNELGRYSCARGTHTDVSGVVKSDADTAKVLTEFADRTKAETAQEFAQILADPKNAYFRRTALAALGIKNSPQCTSKESADVQACSASLSDGLAGLVQRQGLTAFGPKALAGRSGNIEDESYLISDANYTRILDGVVKKAQKELGNLEMQEKIRNNYFPEVKELIIARIDRMNIDEKHKQFMIDKIRGIQFRGFDCAESSSSQSQPSASDRISSLVEPNAFYQPNSNTFKFCSAFLLQTTSEFSIVSVIAHELSHSVDPCELDYGPADSDFHYKDRSSMAALEKEYPLPNLVSCMRDNRSVAAKHLPAPPRDPRDPRDHEPGDDNSPSPQPPAAPDKSFCDDSYRGGESDQITESFADWMAFETLPVFIAKNHKMTITQAREGYANADRLMCWASGYSDGGRDGKRDADVHPSTANRINHLLLANPKIREQMGCAIQPTNGIYCDGETPAPAAPRANQTSGDNSNASQPAPANRQRRGAR